MYAVFFSEHTPLSIACPAFFVADPADGRFGSSKNHDGRIILFNRVDSLFIFIIGIRVDRTRFICAAVPAVAAVSSVKPVFEQRTVITD